MADQLQRTSLRSPCASVSEGSVAAGSKISLTADRRGKWGPRLQRYAPSIVLLLATSFSVWGTWMLIPQSRTLNQPPHGLDITVRSNTKIENASVTISRFDDHRWLVGISLSNNVRSTDKEAGDFPDEIVEASISGLQAAPCDGFKFRAQIKSCEGARDVVPERGDRFVEKTAGWIGRGIQQEAGGGYSGSDVGLAIMVYDSPLIGVVTNSSQSKIALPNLSIIGSPIQPADTVELTATVGIKDAYRQEWSGVTPYRVDRDLVGWRYVADRYEQAQVVVQGLDLSVVDKDQRANFAAGIAAGLAGGAAIATIESLLSAWSSRRD